MNPQNAKAGSGYRKQLEKRMKDPLASFGRSQSKPLGQRLIGNAGQGMMRDAARSSNGASSSPGQRLIGNSEGRRLKDRSSIGGSSASSNGVPPKDPRFVQSASNAPKKNPAASKPGQGAAPQGSAASRSPEWLASSAGAPRRTGGSAFRMPKPPKFGTKGRTRSLLAREAA